MAKVKQPDNWAEWFKEDGVIYLDIHANDGGMCNVALGAGRTMAGAKSAAVRRLRKLITAIQEDQIEAGDASD